MRFVATGQQCAGGQNQRRSFDLTVQDDSSGTRLLTTPRQIKPDSIKKGEEDRLRRDTKGHEGARRRN